MKFWGILGVLFHFLHFSAGYDYGEVLGEALRFYEANRAGKLPSDNRVPWRGDAALDDEIVGGYFDAGDHVKFGFPMAAMTTILAWGGVTFPEGYEQSGNAEWFDKTLRWSTDYFIAAHVGDYELVGQIGDGNLDHAYWGRPEEMTMERPAYRITESAPGSDLAAETAAALASSAMWFSKRGDSEYAELCIDHAKRLFHFADTYRGKYSDSIPNAQDFYNSWGGYADELVWAAAWLAKATGDQSYIEKAENLYSEGISDQDPIEISWDDKAPGAFLLLFELTGKDEYRSKVEKLLDFWMSLPRTPKGLIYTQNSAWGSCRYAANFAHYGVQAAKLGIQEDVMVAFAKSQIDYILGDGGRSYVVGWGDNPPTHCHHRAASCPDLPAVCDWAAINSPDPNPQVLRGAMVGGPNQNDEFVDDRYQYQMTEVATDYNSGFTSLLSAIKALEMRN